MGLGRSFSKEVLQEMLVNRSSYLRDPKLREGLLEHKHSPVNDLLEQTTEDDAPANFLTMSAQLASVQLSTEKAERELGLLKQAVQIYQRLVKQGGEPRNNLEEKTLEEKYDTMTRCMETFGSTWESLCSQASLLKFKTLKIQLQARAAVLEQVHVDEGAAVFSKFYENEKELTQGLLSATEAQLVLFSSIRPRLKGIEQEKTPALDSYKRLNEYSKLRDMRTVQQLHIARNNIVIAVIENNVRSALNETPPKQPGVQPVRTSNISTQLKKASSSIPTVASKTQLGSEDDSPSRRDSPSSSGDKSLSSLASSRRSIHKGKNQPELPEADNGQGKGCCLVM